MSDDQLVIVPQKWTERVPTTIDGAAWRCYLCGWLGEHLYSVEQAQREGMRHFAENHPELAEVDVRLETVGESS